MKPEEKSDLELARENVEKYTKLLADAHAEQAHVQRSVECFRNRRDAALDYLRNLEAKGE